MFGGMIFTGNSKLPRCVRLFGLCFVFLLLWCISAYHSCQSILQHWRSLSIFTEQNMLLAVLVIIYVELANEASNRILFLGTYNENGMEWNCDVMMMCNQTNSYDQSGMQSSFSY
ncbi:hypothetical protein SAY86_032251 [Trapa natans]|uniref:Uncharacterized protein n=1 Tax=Trapa natans TaxID=22666 RepID=A0AAN7RAH7_TRANT|nr:hypothetical protein SAY86_032251 [Trapa natans]